MTTPKRYEETFDAAMFPGARVVEVSNNPDTLETVVVLAYSAQLQQAQPLHVALSRRLATLDALVRTAAREAQVRVLNEILPLYETGELLARFGVGAGA